MTAATLSHLPAMAGSALLHSAGRVSLWAIGQYFRAPLANTGILAMVLLTGMAGSNALYNQTARHPAPLFAPAADVVQSTVEAGPVPAQRVGALPKAPKVTTETTASVNANASVPDAPIGNAEVFALQKKLVELKLFEGTVDGYYGPKTANAIRAFELRMGMKPQGALTRPVIEAIMRASALEQVAEPQPVQMAAQPAVTQPAPAQPMPQPVAAAQPEAQKPATRQVQTLRIAQQPAPATEDRTLVGPVDPVAETLDVAADTAAGAFDSIAGLVEDINASRAQSPSVQPERPVQTPAAAQPQQLQQAPVQQAPVQQVASLPQAPAPAANNLPTTVAEGPAATAGTDTELVSKVQRGLASLGFLAGAIDGVPGEATSRAIRNFEVYYNYDVTGKVSPELVGMLKSAGAAI